ncbi:MAG: efflux RND transporter periplasmic adaptor subunit [Burkholderiales bacterium]|nr:efflux RND transporter periplasmic adaptor subunit [Burkholderiales bacterium]
MKPIVSPGLNKHADVVRANAVALAVAAAGCLPVLAQPVAVPTVRVQAQAVGAVVELDGTIQPVKQSTISAQVAGRVATLSVKPGDKVHAGQVVAVVDDREAAASVQRSQAQIQQADAELRNARAQVERTRDLQRKGFVSQAALDTAEAQYKGAAAARDVASAGALQSSIAQGFTRVTVPYDGWVLQTHAQAGDLAVPGKPLLTVYAPLPLRAVVQVPASRLPVVRAATQTQVQVHAESGVSSWVEPVARSAVPSADPVSQTGEWRLELAPKDSGSLLPGQQVRVRFLQTQTTATSPKLLVPQAAIVRRGELTAVYVAANGAFSLRAVRLGADLGTQGVEVLAGVQSGESVALDPVRAGFAKAAPAASPAPTPQ